MRIRITFLLLLSFTVPSYSIGQTTEQLNKVLAHYSTSPTDSLKYKAALFLIAVSYTHLDVYKRQTLSHWSDCC